MKVFEKKFNLKNVTLSHGEFQRVYYYPITPTVSKISSNRRFVNIDTGQVGGNHWTSFSLKNKSFCLHSSGGAPDKFLLQHLPKPKRFIAIRIKVYILDFVEHIL